MKRILFIMLCLFSFASRQAFAQTNVELLDQLVIESQNEHDRQTTARTEQATVSANEQVNKTQMTTLKGTYRDIQSRFHTLGLVLDAGGVALEATPIVNEIVAQQKQIIALAQQNPLLIAVGLQSEADLADQATLLVDYSAGLILSIGDIDQMKASDRKMLFGYVVTELRQIDGASRGLLNSMNNFLAMIKNNTNPFAGFINQDKGLVDDIMQNAKALK